MKTIKDIEPLVREFKTERDALKERVERCQNEQTAIVRRLSKGIKSAADKTRDAKAALIAAIEQNPHLFEKPRTQTIDGIKVGYQKGKGRLEQSSNTIDLIRKHLPHLADSLINTKETINKTAVGSLSTSGLRKIGCIVTDSGDQVLITVPKDNLDKLVDAMLQEVED